MHQNDAVSGDMLASSVILVFQHPTAGRLVLDWIGLVRCQAVAQVPFGYRPGIDALMLSL